VNTFLSAPQQAAKEQYQAWAAQHLAPIAKQLEERSSSMREALATLGQNGYLGLTVPKEYGGQEAPFLNVILLAEALGEHEPGMALALAEHTAVIELIKKYGSETQKSRHLPLLARGESIAAMAVHEALAGCDINMSVSIARREGSQFVLHGTKTWVANAEFSTLFLVAAKESESSQLFLLLVDASADADSISVGADHKKLGMRSVSTNDVQFSSHKLPVEALLEGSIEEQILFSGDIAKTVIAAAALGMLESSIASSVSHANAREQFGQKISQLQAIQWKIADMSTETAACRMLVYRAAWAKEEEPAQFRKDAAMCKWYAAKIARQQTGEAMQIMGVEGLSDQSAAERFYRDAKVMEICEGTSEFQKVLLASELEI
jgi:alkylation response protein AidB-like acyl-CoA dehydrogenase